MGKTTSSNPGDVPATVSKEAPPPTVTRFDLTRVAPERKPPGAVVGDEGAAVTEMG